MRANSFVIFLLLLVLLTLADSEPCVRLSDVMVFILWQQGEVVGWNDLPENALAPCLARLALVLNLKELRDKTGHNSKHMDHLMVQDQQLASNQIEFKQHLVGNSVDIFCV